MGAEILAVTERVCVSKRIDVKPVDMQNLLLAIDAFKAKTFKAKTFEVCTPTNKNICHCLRVPVQDRDNFLKGSKIHRET